MLSLLTLWTSCVCQAPPTNTCPSYLYQPSYCFDDWLRGPAVPYTPRPGDLILATDKSVFWKVTHDLAMAGEPHSSAIVVARPDGSLGTLEAGPNTTFFVAVLDTMPHLQEYADKGKVWVRQRKTPLTAEQCARLTEFACATDGKRFALGRLAVQLTPFRTRGPVRTQYVGKPHGVQGSYFCSELVTEALVAASLIDPCLARPSATYPHELFFDDSPNRYLQRTFSLAECWEPPARWTSCPRTPIVLPAAPEGLPLPKEKK